MQEPHTDTASAQLTQIASLALEEHCATQDLPYAAVRERLQQTGQVVDLPATAAVPNEIV